MKIAEAQSLNNIISNDTITTMQSADNPAYLVLKDMNMAFLKENSKD